MLLRLLAVLFTALLLTAAAVAADHVGVASGKTLYRFDSVTGQTTLIGTYLTTDPMEHGIVVIERAADGTLYGLSTGQSAPVVVNVLSRIYRIDEQTAQATEVAQVGAIPVGGLAIDPTSGLFYHMALGSGPYGPLGPENMLMRVDVAGGGVPKYLGDLPITAGQFRDLVFDPLGQMYSLNLTTNTLWRVDPNNPGGAGTVPIGSGLGGGIDLSYGGSLAQGTAVGKVLGYERRNTRTFSIDLASGLGTPLTSIQPPEFMDFATEGCLGKAKSIGSGCPGSGGLVPALAVGGCPAVGRQINIEIRNGLGGALSVTYIGPGTSPVPLGFGCTLHVWPVLPQPIILPLGGVGAGGGSVTLSALIPPAAAVALVYLQTFVFDAASPIGAAAANAIELTIP